MLQLKNLTPIITNGCEVFISIVHFKLSPKLKLHRFLAITLYFVIMSRPRILSCVYLFLKFEINLVTFFLPYSCLADFSPDCLVNEALIIITHDT